ncbi:MAG: hypothetical protein ABJX32_07675 [Tateyamaria sp.]|uniref:hypothetical protein n=1 Tax=Tateyamaria sp. TaxID=1929288 RepID=UPI00329C540A
MRFGFSGNDSKNVDVTNVIVYLLETEEFIERPKEVRAVHINLPIAEFFSFFKRFDLIMSTSSMILDQDTIVDGPHYD